MINTDRLLGLMAENHVTGKYLAGKMGIAEATFYRKMKARKFSSDEMKVLIDEIPIKEPLGPIFFAD